MNRLTRIQGFFSAFIVLLFLSISIPAVFSPVIQAASPQQLSCEGSGGTWTDGKCVNTSSNGPSLPATVKAAINILLFLIGVIAVIVIVIQGFRFVNSNGDTQAVSKAKNGIIFALIGVAVAFIAYAIVNFVLDQL